MLACLCVVVLFILSSCFVWKYDNLLTERNRDDVPNIVGNYRDNQGQEITIQKTEFSNTFVVSPPNGQSPIRVTMEMIEPKRFLAQGSITQQETGLPQYFLSVVEIDGRKITVYFFPGLEEKIGELAKQNNIKVEMVGFKQKPEDKEVSAAFNILTEYNSVDGVVGFFNSLFTLEGSTTVIFNKR
jgi:hypothetical protein